jgi:chromosome segregation ATPase
VNCPKCGFLQEERIDCLKCGIVISKYLAFGLPTAPPQTNAVFPAIETSPAPERQNHAPSAELIEMRQTIKELQRQVADLEFGRAERARVRAEFKTLGDRVRDELAAIGGRITRVEESHREVTEGLELVSPEELLQLEKDLKETYISPIRDRVEAIEHENKGLAARVAAFARSMEGSAWTDAFSGLERRLSALEDAVKAVETASRAHDSADLLPRLDEAVAEIGKMRSSLESVSMRYSEIGDLKKNHLVLSSTLDSVRTGLDAFKRQIADGFPRTLAELAREVAALRAEYRQIWAHVHPADIPANK